MSGMRECPASISDLHEVPVQSIESYRPQCPLIRQEACSTHNVVWSYYSTLNGAEMHCLYTPSPIMD